ncbi:glutamate synthase (ferredoxin) [Eubacterium ruminantium]|uniref:Glutamate synthase (Ferredoxin) n=1 Tax=Eubacterium ruminantium TaxID=42322 RepID=A0A1T4MNV3_9FIRM|nr:glutamate synthase large subunit [Eubacterium ruminantium]SCW49458.1 glutamate synthase (ferredoxin) [Eubacterium ruminantium]SDM60357.1 glutamate synthase (ferredoxin) [Eubacterium ruminantium]SJZ68780.1 glutamate synthase (ferredoxin) [Eubacterium ruminantium]
MEKVMEELQKKGLYDSSFEHDNCGIGAVVQIDGKVSHKLVTDALSIVEKLEHRAGKDAEGETGDGVGILTQIPHKFFVKKLLEQGVTLPDRRNYAVGMFFLPQNELDKRQEKTMFEVIVRKEGMKILGWREVETSPNVLGSRARECMPVISQVFIERPEGCETDLDFDRKLYLVRREFEQSSVNTYVPSLSCRTIVYKGMFLVGQLRTFFKDLTDKDFESSIAMVHSRFSTNTNPSWNRAHPNRLMVHNGEINTIRGNADKMLAREETMHTDIFSNEDMTRVFPVISSSGSDSAMLDNTLEFCMMSGMELPLAAMIAIPEPWAHNETLSREERDFYQYYATMMEPWDGPASILYSDGDVMGAILDRNGLRPSRYYIMDDNRLILSSEVGVLDLDEAHIVKKERLHPGKMLLIDTKKGKIYDDKEIKEKYAHREPYGEWLDMSLVTLKSLKIPNIKVPDISGEERKKLQKSFGYTYENFHEGIRNMALSGTEQIGAMGVDTPIAALSKEDQPLFYFFKQLFAQVTNPPIDAEREKIVTSKTIYLGKNGNLLSEKPENARVLKIDNPILSDLDLLKIEKMNKEGFKVAKVSMLYYKKTPLKRVIEHLFVEVDKAYKEGANILILSDRGVDENHVAIPSLLAVAAVSRYLVKTKKTTAMSLIVESGEPREVHHFATLLGYGASAVNPYLAHATIKELVDDGLLEKDYYAAVHDYDNAIINGIVKIASKMGISTIRSYQGSKIFEAIGISPDVINEYFTGTVSRIGGITLADIEKSVDKRHSKAFDPLGLETDLELSAVGRHKLRSQGEHHRYNPQTIHMLQSATREGSYEKFKTYTSMVDQEETGYLRSLMDFNFPENGIDINEVESEEEIVKRFKTGAMSYGSISEEAHETLAIAMNHLHGKSNSGEGGESDERIASAGTKNDRSSAIKQVASGRFGVTSKYLVSAREIQIKMAQGAKPGEGGHLPGKKVYPWVAKTRHSTPGVSLISPPPHHDIYSIEDLAQLIYDLKNANKNARISVKLVSEAGVGTVAAGVAKAGAQVILVSGYDGGTGAAPLSSIHNAGLPWELGLAETHQTLISNGLRNRVVIETDGKLMSGRDVAIAAILGAEEFGFATAPLVTMGCVMMRVCNQDTCPVGVATQNPRLRKNFKGKPEYVENFMLFVARELREYMAKLGVRSIDELVGRTDLLKVKDEVNKNNLDLSGILLDMSKIDRKEQIFDEKKVYDFKLEETLDEKVLLKSADIKNAFKSKKKCSISIEVTNTDRTFGTLLGAEITRAYPEGLPEDTIEVNCVGAGGQSFGAFIPKGLTLKLTGDSNDYFGKGLSGGKLILHSPSNISYVPEENIIVGNVALYGATSGEAYISGMAGERFCIRNSGATAVVEGVGEHGCEYMTGGRAVILGRTGKNFAAGMSGGIAYVFDEENTLYKNLNKTFVLMERVLDKNEISELKSIIEKHVEYTGSKKGQRILDNFDEAITHFKKIIPSDYKEMLRLTNMYIEQGCDSEEAKIKAFETFNQ